MPSVLQIVGARPNFLKLAPVVEAIAEQAPRAGAGVTDSGGVQDGAGPTQGRGKT